MKESTLYKKSALYSALLYFLTFLIFYVGNLLDGVPAFFGYLSIFLRDGAFFILPSVLALALIHSYCEYGMKKTALRALPLALPYLAYALPFYYVSFTLSGYTITEVLLLLLLQSFSSLFISYASLFLLCIFSVLIGRALVKRGISSDIKSLLKSDTPSRFDLKNGKNAMLFTPSAVLFAVFFVRELIDTVSYLISYSGSYRPEEIVYIVLRYVFLPILLLLSCVLTHKIADFKEK